MLQSGRRGRLSDVGNQWIGLTIDCDWAGPMARFYEGLLGFEVRVLGPGGRWAQLFHPDGGVHINIQGDPGYESPTWPEQPGELAKMMHFEVQVDDLDEAINRTLELGGAEAPWQPPDRNRERIRVMLDPAGHPLCLFLRGE
jgi:catechol 2,3-dioxygenase-like lactoylglutathione lyase family enzyme